MRQAVAAVHVCADVMTDISGDHNVTPRVEGVDAGHRITSFATGKPKVMDVVFGDPCAAGVVLHSISSNATQKSCV